MKAHFLAPLLRQPDARWHLVGRVPRTRPATDEVVERVPRTRPASESDDDARYDVVIATAIHTAFDSRSRREGLLKQEVWPAGSALIIAPCQAVHTVGMKFAIDVVFVDRAGGVVKVRERVRPLRATGALRAFATIELPAGSLDGALRPGDTLALVASP